MKNNKFNLSDNDIKAISCALEVMTSYPFYETDFEQNIACMFSASSTAKLSRREPLSDREVVFVAIAIDNAFKALRGELSIDDEDLSALRPYLFTINKLHPVFLPFVDKVDF